MMVREVLAAIAAVAVGAGCHQRTGAPALAEVCAAVAQAEPVAMSIVPNLSGAFRLVVVATGGPQTGRRAVGRLDLRPQDQRLLALPEPVDNVLTSQALIGRTNLVAADVGAVAMGDATAEDPRMPGVALYVTTGEGGNARSVVMRVGAQSNSRGMQALDAGYWAFHVQRASLAGFEGVWMSGDGSMEVARGHFCALRLTN